MSQENQEAEDPERDELVIRDGQEEEQDADEEGERLWAAAFPQSPSRREKGPPKFTKQQFTRWWFILFVRYPLSNRTQEKEQCTPQHLDVSEIIFRES